MILKSYFQEHVKYQRARRCLPVLLAVLFLVSSQPGGAVADDHRAITQLSALVTNGGYLVKSDRHPIDYRKNDLFLPASTLKILTSLAALDLLGPQFRFETHFFLDQKHNLYIKGFGDPFLTSEEVLHICTSLKERGVEKIHNLFLDTSSFALKQQTPGTMNSSNPYDAPNGALAVNFNTLAINKRADGTIQSAEPQTPSLPLMAQLGRHLPPGTQRININLAKPQTNMPIALQYVGELFCAQLRNTGIPVEGKVESAAAPPSLRPYFIHKNSKTLAEVMGECLHYSNNYIANQVYLYCGLHTGGAPATWKKARVFITNYLQKTLKLSPQQIYVQDGAGLSRKNRISAEALVTILEHFKPYSSLLNQRSGTLLKSGTLQDVYCYGGYFTEHGLLTPFAILLNQKENTRDELLKRLHLIYSTL